MPVPKASYPCSKGEGGATAAPELLRISIGKRAGRAVRKGLKIVLKFSSKSCYEISKAFAEVFAPSCTLSRKRIINFVNRISVDDFV